MLFTVASYRCFEGYQCLKDSLYGDGRYAYPHHVEFLCNSDPNCVAYTTLANLQYGQRCRSRKAVPTNDNSDSQICIKGMICALQYSISKSNYYC